MNKMGAGPSLTILVIGIAAFIAIFTMATNVYIDAMNNNPGGSLDSNFTSKYSQVMGYQTNLTKFQNNATSDLSIYSTVSAGLSSTFNVLIIGIGALGSFFSFMTIVPSLFNTLTAGSGLAIPIALTTFVTFVALIFITMKVYKAYRNAGEEA